MTHLSTLTTTNTIAFCSAAGIGAEEPYEPLQSTTARSSLSLAVRVRRIGNHGYVLDPPFLPTYSLNQKEPYADGAYASFLATRHSGRANVCFVDGHVESVEPKLLYKDNARWNGHGVDAAIAHVSTRPLNWPRY